MPDDTGAAVKPATEIPLPSRFEVPAFMVPSSLAEVRELARLIALAEWAPDSYRDLDGNYRQQKIALAIMHGVTVGLGPIAAVQSIAVIEGMPTIWGDGALALVERSGLLEDMVEEYETHAEEGLTAVCTMRRRRRPTPIVNRFSWAMAEHAHLLQKEGPWRDYPERMLKMRARSWTLRDGFADMLRGVHIREEVDDFIEIRGLWTSLRSAVQETKRGAARPNGMARPRRTPEPKRASELAAGVTEPPSAAGPETATSAEAPRIPVEPGEPELTEGRDAVAAKPHSVAEPETATSAGPDAAAENGDAPEPAVIGAETAAANAAPQENYTLADAEGGLIEVAGADVLRSEFGRRLFDKHLSPDQVLDLWESNEQARRAIERRFGAEALEAAAKRVQAAEAATRQQAAGTARPKRHGIGAQSKPNGTSASEEAKPRSARAGRRLGKRASEANPDLALRIDPGWGDQKVFRHYRTALIAVHNRHSGAPSEIMRFRNLNAAVEARLRARLPERMREIDAICDLAPLPDERP